MTTVQETLALPGGVDPQHVVVTIDLAGAAGDQLPAGYSSTGDTIVGHHRLRPDSAGAWTLDLHPNADITPAGTRWRVVLSTPNLPGSGVSGEARYLAVPSSGPVDVADILDEAPGTVESSALAAHAAATSGVHGLGTASQMSPAQLAADPALVGAFAGVAEPPYMFGRAGGLLYDGTDESVAFQALVDQVLDAGGGTIVLEGVVRCDSQITLKTTTVDDRLRMAPLRITGLSGSSRSGAWPPFSGDTDSGELPGLDLRYAGRTDSATTTKGSTFIANTSAVAGDRGNIIVGAGIPDQCWILHVKAGEGWITTKAARASATTDLTSFGGRIQGFGYGALEIDHLQLLNRGVTASSAPFGLTTGPSVKFHDNLVIGHETKTGQTCDEDPWVFGGPGQGTILTTGLTSGNNYTSLTVAAVPLTIRSGASIVIGYGAGSTQTVTTSAQVAAGATSIPVTSFTANADYASDTGVYVGPGLLEGTPEAFAVPSAQFQGYPSHVEENHFARIRRIAFGQFATSVHVDDNAWMHDCGSNLAVNPSTLTSGLTRTTNYTTLAVTALAAPVLTGDVIQVGTGPFSQETVASADAAAGATSIPVTSFTANADYAAGTGVVNTTAGIGAMVESFADSSAVNSVGVSGNRMGFSGGYSFATRFCGATIGSFVSGNDLQDQADGAATAIGAHRCDRGALHNTFIAGLAPMPPGQVFVDDWSHSTGPGNQTIVHSDENYAPRSVGSHVARNTPSRAAEFSWEDGGAEVWRQYVIPGTGLLYVRDMANGVMAMTVIPAPGTGGQVNFAGTIHVGSSVVQHASGAQWMSGTGSPEGARTAGVGSLYTQTDGTAGTSLWVKESGTGNTGWVAK